MVERVTSGQKVPPRFLLGRHSTVSSIASVPCDATRSVTEPAAHLWQRGYRRAVCMGVPLTVSTSLGRRTAYRAVWRERGINLPEIVVADYDTSHAREAVGAHLAALPASERPDVLI